MSDEIEHIRENAVLLGDVAKFFRQKKRKILNYAIIGGVSCGLLSLLMPIKYNIIGLFKDGGSSAGGLGSANPVALLLQGPKSQNSFAALMKSRTILDQVVAASGIQVSEELMSLPRRVMKRIRRNLSSAYNKKIAWPESVTFKNVHYDGKNPCSFQIKGIDASTFVLRSSEKEEITGILGVPIRFQDVELTVDSVQKNVLKRWIRFNVVPKERLINDMQKSIHVTSSKEDDSILEIKMQDGLPARAISVVNSVMDVYKQYLLSESARITNEHLENLYEHKKYVQNRIALDLQKYGHTMQQNVDASGFLEVQLELQYLYEQEKQLVSNSLQKEKQLKALKMGIPSGDPELALVAQMLNDEKKLLSEIHALASEHEDSFCQLNFPSVPVVRDPILRSYFSRNVQSKISLSNESVIRHIFSSPSNQQLSMNPMQESPKKASLLLFDKETLTQYMVTLLREMQQLQLSKDALVLAKNKLQEELYDLQSLRVFARELNLPNVVNFDDLLLKYENVAHFTEKERRQIEEKVTLVKEILAKAIGERVAFHTQKEQAVSGELRLAQEALQEVLEKKRQSLSSFRKQIENEFIAMLEEDRERDRLALQKIKDRLKKIPQKWALESELKLSADVDKSIMSNLLQFIESKNVQKKIDSVEARPLDVAYCSPNPVKASMVAFGIAGMGAGSFLGTAALFLLGLIRGLPISGANVRFKGYSFLGTLRNKRIELLNTLDEMDLEVLRAATAASRGKLTAVMQGHGPRYAGYVAQLLGYSGNKVLLLDIEKRIDLVKQGPGLYEYVNGVVSELPVVLKEQYDEMTFGKSDVFTSEFLRSKQCIDAIAKLQEQYDQILLVTRAPLFSDEVRACIELSSAGLLSFQNETWEEVRQMRVLAKEMEIPLHFIEY